MASTWEAENFLEGLGEEFFAIMGILLFFFAIFALIGFVFYILRSLALYTIAKRRGVPAPGLAWVPVASDFTLGAICDNICSFINVRSYNRFVLLGCRIAQMLFYGLSVQRMIYTAMSVSSYGGDPDEMASAMMMGEYALWNGLSSLVGLAYLIFMMISLYRIFQCYKPQNAVLYLILGFFFPFLRDIFLFSVRNEPGSLPSKTTVAAVSSPIPTPEAAPAIPTEPSPSTQDAWDRYKE